MSMDALMQYLVSRKWRDMLVLEGPLPADAQRTKAFEHSAQEVRRPHRRAPALQARHRSARARAERSRAAQRDAAATTTWCSSPTTPSISCARCPTTPCARARWSAASISSRSPGTGPGSTTARRRSIRASRRSSGGRHMEGADWAAWIAVKMIVQSALRTRSTDFAKQRDFILGDASFDGDKGLRRGRAAVGPPGAPGGAARRALRGGRERAGRGLPAPHQRARHARRRRAGNALPSEQVGAKTSGNHAARSRRPRTARRHHARDRQVRAAARAAAVGAGAAADVARGVRGRLLQRVRRLDHPALQDLHHLSGLYRAGPARHHPAVPRHAVLAVDGLRPRDGGDAAPAHRAAAALGAAGLQARGRNGALGHHLLRVPRRSASCST